MDTDGCVDRTLVTATAPGPFENGSALQQRLKLSISFS
jgi:hypothetical protein